VSANKLVRVASIASIENQEILADRVKLLSKSALETLLRDEKSANSKENNMACTQSKINTNLFEKNSEIKSLPGQTSNTIN